MIEIKVARTIICKLSVELMNYAFARGTYLKMMGKTIKSISPVIICLVFAGLTISSMGHAKAADPFSTLRGNWGGGGTMVLKDGRKERLVCTAQYTGTSSQLGLSIKCKSSSNAISMKAQLSANAGRLLGTWEEKTYKAIGTISGISSENSIKFYIGGNVLGTMAVRYSKTRQDVSIQTTGVSLKDVNLKLTRR